VAIKTPLVPVFRPVDDLCAPIVFKADLLAEGVIVLLLLLLPPSQSADNREAVRLLDRLGTELVVPDPIKGPHEDEDGKSTCENGDRGQQTVHDRAYAGRTTRLKCPTEGRAIDNLSPSKIQFGRSGGVGREAIEDAVTIGTTIEGSRRIRTRLAEGRQASYPWLRVLIFLRRCGPWRRRHQNRNPRR